MKLYKPTSCISLPFFFAKMMVICFPMALVMDIAAACDGETKLGQTLLASFLIGMMFFGISVLIWFLLSRIGKLLSKEEIMLDDTTVQYRGKIIALDQIRYITLYLPVASRTSSQPQTLTIWADNSNYFEIKHPSLELVAQLKRRCHYASFHINDVKKELKEDLIVGLAAAVMALLGIFFGE